MGIKLATVILLGPPAMAVLIFEVLLNGTAMFNHGNIRLTLKIDREEFETKKRDQGKSHFSRRNGARRNVSRSDQTRGKVWRSRCLFRVGITN